VPEQAPGEKNPLLQLAIKPSYTALEESSQVSSFTPSTLDQAAALLTANPPLQQVCAYYYAILT
jgi:hypothetical protein